MRLNFGSKPGVTCLIGAFRNLILRIFLLLFILYLFAFLSWFTVIIQVFRLTRSSLLITPLITAVVRICQNWLIRIIWPVLDAIIWVNFYPLSTPRKLFLYRRFHSKMVFRLGSKLVAIIGGKHINLLHWLFNAKSGVVLWGHAT